MNYGTESDMNTRTTILQVGGLHWATSERGVEDALMRRPGVLVVEANAVSQTASITYDTDRTAVAELADWIRDCGYHCAGQSVPEHMCDPMAEPSDLTTTKPPAAHTVAA